MGKRSHRVPSRIDNEFLFGAVEVDKHSPNRGDSFVHSPNLSAFKCDVDDCDSAATYTLMSLATLDGKLSISTGRQFPDSERTITSLPIYQFHKLCATHRREHESDYGKLLEEVRAARVRATKLAKN